MKIIYAISFFVALGLVGWLSIELGGEFLMTDANFQQITCDTQDGDFGEKELYQPDIESLIKQNFLQMSDFNHGLSDKFNPSCVITIIGNNLAVLTFLYPPYGFDFSDGTPRDDFLFNLATMEVIKRIRNYPRNTQSRMWSSSEYGIWGSNTKYVSVLDASVVSLYDPWVDSFEVLYQEADPAVKLGICEKGCNGEIVFSNDGTSILIKKYSWDQDKIFAGDEPEELGILKLALPDTVHKYLGI